MIKNLSLWEGYINSVKQGKYLGALFNKHRKSEDDMHYSNNVTKLYEMPHCHQASHDAIKTVANKIIHIMKAEAQE